MVIDKEKILGIAQRYILKGQSKKAIKEYTRLIEASPKDKRLHLKLGDLYLKSGENEKAAKVFLKLADIYTEEDLSFRAIAIYKKVLSINPKHVEAFHKIAKLYLKEGLIGNARNCYQSILAISPQDQEALDALDSAVIKQPQKDSSKKAFTLEASLPAQPYPQPERVTAETPALNGDGLTPVDKDSEMHYHLGIAYKEMELFDLAVSEFELASSNPSVRFDCYIMLGDCYMEQGNYDKSIDYLKMAAEIKGPSAKELARLYYNLGLAFEGKGLISEAFDTFKLVLEHDQSFKGVQEKIKKLQEAQK